MQVAAKQQYISAEPAVEAINESYWYSFNSTKGEPEGSEEATSYEEAATQWGEHLLNGDMHLLQVWGPQGVRWFKIERELHGVNARECEV